MRGAGGLSQKRTCLLFMLMYSSPSRTPMTIVCVRHRTSSEERSLWVCQHTSKAISAAHAFLS